MVTSREEWVFKGKGAFDAGNRSEECLKDVIERHVLFPAIRKAQFEIGSAEYIPLFHDGIKEQALKELENVVT
ncbi:LAQU0S12e02564g1_1 [Lachancea quebecensis]|uniref:LAQU0S12e02564g1_1 n=1 Tax=Lachancea quebecensis TaxID=1654605 RepID=A0A0P1KVQ5_9SACH|nr:LAQU0S12e02564g1_1 [Lachancea quebecensis]